MEKLIKCKTGFKRRSPRTGKGHQPQVRLVKASPESGTVPGGRSYSTGYKTSDWDTIPACQIGTDRSVDSRPEFTGKTQLQKGAGVDRTIQRIVKASLDAYYNGKRRG